jgi:hypothetical protein
MFDLGMSRNYLGVELEYHLDGLFLHQKGYI